MLVSLTVGKVDAGVTVLLTPDKRLIEFPSILLPPDIVSGSIVDITVGRNTASEAAAERKFRALQDQIYAAFGAAEPAVPVLRCRNATQTSVVLEWDPIQLATADLISLSLFRNGQKAGNIPDPKGMHSTKISGLAVDTEYTFHLVLRTTAGTYASERVRVRTHKMTDLSGITITMGVLPSATREALARAVERVGAKIVDGVRIDTTHFVTTEGRGVAWERANEMNIPVVRPEWVEACEKNGRILGVTKFYLDALRPGPPGEEVGSGQPQQPPAPPLSSNPPEPPPKDDVRETEAAGSKEVGEKEEDQDDEDDEEDEAEDKSRLDEQKVRAEEKEEKLPIRPKPSIEDDEDDEDEDGGNGKLEPGDGSGSKGSKSPGDNASFQDVAL